MVTPFATSVAPGASTTLVIQLDATQAGSFSGDLSFADNDPNNDPFLCTVTGTVNSPSPTIEVLSGSTVLVNEAVQSGNAVNFGSTAQGTPVEQTFTVENTGAAALTLDPDSLSLPDGFSLVTPFAGSVAPGASTTLVVQLDGVNPGQYAGDIEFTDNDPANDPFLISVSGTVNSIAPSISVSDGTNTLGDGSGEEFATTVVGTPVSMTFTISNGGNAALALQPDSLTVPEGFQVTSPFAATLAPGGSTSFTVELSATSAGEYAGTVSFADNDPAQGTFSFAVSGEVQLPPPSMGVWDGATALANGASDCFGATPVGTGIFKTFTIRNTGTGTLAIDRESFLLPAGFSLAAPPASSVAPGGSTSFTVQLDTAQAAEFSGTLEFASSDPANGQFSLGLASLVQAPGPAIEVLDGAAVVRDGGSLSTPAAIVGSPALTTFQIVNVGSQSLSLDPGSLVLPAGFSLVSPYAGSLAPGGTTQLHGATGRGRRRDLFRHPVVQHRAASQPFAFAVSGIVDTSLPWVSVLDGATPLTGLETGVDLGSTVAGTPLAETFTIENAGGALLTLDPGSLALPAGFSLTAPFASSVPPGCATSFSVQLDAAAPGRFCGEISFTDNDPLSPMVQFAIGGSVVAAAPQLAVVDGGAARKAARAR